MSEFDYSLLRCDGCQLIGATGRNGGNLPECACLTDPLLRTGHRLRVRSVGGWESTTKTTGRPLALRTVDGPPALVWIQGRDAYALFVGGHRVLEIEGCDMEDLSPGLLNEVLARGTVIA